MLLSACASLTSTTMIPAGQSFRLGGGQPGAFTVRGTNSGSVPVVGYSEVAGKRDSLLTLAPGANVDTSFPATATVVFGNTSTTKSATVSIKVTGDVGGLGMGYESKGSQ